MGQAARRQTVQESARESVRAQHISERASSSSVALSLMPLLLLLCLLLYMCACLCVCVFECALRAKLIFLFIKKKSKYICIFVCCAAFFFTSPSPSFLPPPRTDYYFCCCCQKHNLCFIYDFLWFFFFPIGIFYLPETCLIYTQRHLATHSSKTWRRRGRGHSPGPGPRRTLDASICHITFGYRFGFEIGFRFGESSPAQFGVLHLPLTYIVEVLFTRAILIKTKGTFALISLFSFQYIYKRFFHFYGFFDGWKTCRKKRLWKVCWLRRVAFCVWNFVCWNLCCLTLLFVSLTQSPEHSRAEHTGHFLLRSVCFSSHPPERAARTECALNERAAA